VVAGSVDVEGGVKATPSHVPHRTLSVALFRVPVAAWLFRSRYEALLLPVGLRVRIGAIVEKPAPCLKSVDSLCCQMLLLRLCLLPSGKAQVQLMDYSQLLVPS